MFGVSNRIGGLAAGYGMVQELASVQRYVNRYYHYFDKNIREAAHTRILVACFELICVNRCALIRPGGLCACQAKISSVRMISFWF
ncbi:hypothetical protein AGMMS49992_10510 [Clostridia bacterium]|nr:hypothetical protein AGMMS49992_10510 [Clostridia bacterium]